MKKNESLQLFENKEVRSVWDEEQEKWYISIVDVVEVLTESERPRKYWDDLKRKLLTEGSELSEKIGQLKMQAPDGKMRLTDVADVEQLFRLIQSIPSPKAEPLWLYNEKLWGVMGGSFKPEFLGCGEHFVVKRADAHVFNSINFAHINSRCKMNCIKAFTSSKRIVWYDRIGKRISNIVKKDSVHKFAQLNFPSFKTFNIKHIFISFVKSFQRNISFNFKQNGTHSKLAAIPNIMGFLFSFFFQQYCKDKRGIKIIYHKLKSVGTRILVILSPVQVIRNIRVIRNRKNFVAFRESNFTLSCKVHHISNESSFNFTFNRNKYSIAEVYGSTVGRFGSSNFSFYSGCGFHNNSVEDGYIDNVENFREAA